LKNKKFYLLFLGIFTSGSYKSSGNLGRVFCIENENKAKTFCIQD